MNLNEIIELMSDIEDEIGELISILKVVDNIKS